MLHLPTHPRLVLALAGLALLAGCAAMSPKECQQADWHGIGLRDGQEGEPLSKLDDRVKACAEAGVMANQPLYLDGRNQGLPLYCRLDNAARLGLEGKPYQGVCAAGIDAEFRRRHAVGWEVYQARQALDSLDGRRRTLEKKLAKAGNDDERKNARDDLRDLDRDLRRARDRVRDAEWNYDRLR